MHTHSTYATAWAARGEPIPCVLTAMADEFGGEIPVGPFALIGDDAIGRGIVETLRIIVPPQCSCATTASSPSAVREGRGQGGGDVRGRRPDGPHPRRTGGPLPIDPTTSTHCTAATRTSTANTGAGS